MVSNLLLASEVTYSFFQLNTLFKTFIVQIDGFSIPTFNFCVFTCILKSCSKKFESLTMKVHREKEEKKKLVCWGKRTDDVEG